MTTTRRQIQNRPNSTFGVSMPLTRLQCSLGVTNLASVSVSPRPCIRLMSTRGPCAARRIAPTRVGGEKVCEKGGIVVSARGALSRPAWGLRRATLGCSGLMMLVRGGADSQLGVAWTSSIALRVVRLGTRSSFFLHVPGIFPVPRIFLRNVRGTCVPTTS